MHHELAKLGERLIACKKNCGAASPISLGTPPRCMYLDGPHETDRGVIIAGLNPGRAQQKEIDYYKENGLRYQSTVDFLKNEIAVIPYYKRTKDFVAGLGLSDSIHWTELAKCELRRDTHTVPNEMISNCARAFLREELSIIEDWPVIAVGRVAFNALALMCPDRAVIGIPHTTGSWGAKFSSLCLPGTTTPKQEIIEKVTNALAERSAVWLG